MRRRLVVSYLALTVFVLVVLEVPLGLSFARSERNALISRVRTDALVMGTLVEDSLEGAQTPHQVSLARRYASDTGGRVVVVDLAGLSVIDTGDAAGREFASRPEVKSALAGTLVSGFRHSSSLGIDLVFVAAPVASGGRVLGAVRITYPASALAGRVRGLWIALGIVAAIVLAIVAGLGVLLARSVTKPLQALDDAAGSIAQGDLAARAAPGGAPPEIASLVRTFNDMAARLQELIGSQRAFVADASHQLRTPLTALRLRLENLSETVPGPQQEDVEAAIREVWRLSRIVDGLLAIARAEGTRPERAMIDVTRIVRDRVDAWEPLASERGVRLVVDGNGESASAVPGHLEQMLDNLIANAIEVSPDGSEIVLRSHRIGDWCEIHVADSGPGMTEEQRAGAFARFWHGGRPGGTGLGLAIVKQLASTSGGEAALEESAGGGLDAVVRLPAA